MDLNQRSAGVLLHITSLPGPHGIGDFGPEARRFVDWLYAAGQRIWQWLPSNPIGPGDSPYKGVSAFAGSLNEKDLLDHAGILFRRCGWAQDQAI